MLENNINNLTPHYTFIGTNLKSNNWSKSSSKQQIHCIMLYTQFNKQTHQLHLSGWYTKYSTPQLKIFILTCFLHPYLEKTYL